MRRTSSGGTVRTVAVPSFSVSASGTVRVEGIYPGYEGVYNFILNLDSGK